MQKRRDQNPSIVPEDQMLIASWGACVSVVGIDCFPLAGGMKQKVDCCRHTHWGVFLELVVRVHRTLVHTPDHIPAPDALALKGEKRDVNDNYYF